MRAVSLAAHPIRLFAVLLSLLLSGAVFAQAKHSIDQPAQPLADAIRAVGKQSVTNILFDPAIASGKTAQPLKGQFTVDEALERVLSGSGLVAEKVQDGTISIRPKAGAARGVSQNPTLLAPAQSQSGGMPVEPIESIVVTGSNFRTARNNTETPVTVIGQNELEALGINSNMLEVLRKSVPAIAGRSNAGNSNANNVNQNTAGGSRVQIRNLDTLVLVNGRRLTSSGINAIGGKDFVDLNRIPAAAIERLEVLTDGASAIYGADAVGGVVNIILKSDFKGVEAGTRYGSAEGGYHERSAYVTGGAGSPGAHFTATASWSKTDPLFQSQRPFSSNYVGRLTSFPGVANGALLNPRFQSPSQANPTGANAIAGSLTNLIANGTYIAANDPSIAPGISSQFDAAPYQTLLLQQDQQAFVSSGSAELLGRKLVLFGDYMYSKTKSFNQMFQARNNLQTVTVPAGAPFNPLTSAFPGVVVGDLSNPLQTYNDTRANRVVLGFRGLVGDNWNWESAYTYDHSKLTQNVRNSVYLPNLSRAIAGGYDASGNPTAGGGYSRVITGFSESGNFVIQPALDPFARGGIAPASVANLLGTANIMAASKLTSFDAKIVGTPFDLPAGDLGVAVGGSFRREGLEGETDPNSSNTGPSGRRWGGVSFFDPFSTSRTVSAGFVEVRVPIASPSYSLPGAQVLELSAAARREHYSDTGNSTVPKIGLIWRPGDQQVTFRGAYTKAYNAPTLYNLFGPDQVTTSGPAVLATQLNEPRFQGLIYNQINGGNPNLKPSTAQNRSFGMVLVPEAIKGLTMAVDYSGVSQTGFQGAAGDVLNSVDRLGAASRYINQVAFNAFPGQPGAVAITVPGQLTSYLLGGGNSRNIYTRGGFINLSGINVKSIDFSAVYGVASEDWGKFQFSTLGTYIRTYKFQADPNQSAYEYAGYATNGGQGVQGTMPKYRLYSTVTRNFKPWQVTIANTFIPSVTDIGPGGLLFYSSPRSVERRVASYTTWDLQLAYSLAIGPTGSNLRFAAGVNNVANRMPPLAPQAFPDNNADTSTYSPTGRLFFATVTAKF